jgi:hypothetical protein
LIFAASKSDSCEKFLGGLRRKRKGQALSDDETQTASKDDLQRLTVAIETLVARLETGDAAVENIDSSEHGHDPRELIEKITHQLTEYVEAHPVRSTVIAFIAGLIIASRGQR